MVAVEDDDVTMVFVPLPLATRQVSLPAFDKRGPSTVTVGARPSIFSLAGVGRTVCVIFAMLSLREAAALALYIASPWVGRNNKRGTPKIEFNATPTIFASLGC